jgi:hypothetical protein
MKHRILTLLMAIATIIPSHSFADKSDREKIPLVVPTELQDKDSPVISSFEVTSMSFRLMLAAWDDGTVVWCDDWTQYGNVYDQGAFVRPQYLMTTIDPEKVQSVIEALENEGVFNIQRTSRLGGELGASHQTMTIVTKYDFVELSSRIDIVEFYHDKLMGPNGESIAVNSENKEEILDKFSDEYQEFRYLWGFTRDTIYTLIDESEKAPTKLQDNTVKVIVKKLNLIPDPDPSPTATPTP